MEESGLTKRNIQQDVGGRTQSRNNTSSNLLSIRQAAARDSRMQFTALFHHITLSLLKDSFFQLKRNSAAGADGVTWQSYQQDLDTRLKSLHERVHKGSYRPRPARRVFIPKADGSERPLSILCLEDKIIQQAVVKVLEGIYEEEFLGFSYGFRCGRSQNDAMDALIVGIKRAGELFLEIKADIDITTAISLLTIVGSLALWGLRLEGKVANIELEQSIDNVNVEKIHKIETEAIKQDLQALNQDLIELRGLYRSCCLKH